MASLVSLLKAEFPELLLVVVVVVMLGVEKMVMEVSRVRDCRPVRYTWSTKGTLGPVRRQWRVF